MELGALAIGAGVVYYLVSSRREDDTTRAAETVVQKTEERSTGALKPSYTKPAFLPGAGSVATAFGPYQGFYHPLLDTDPERREEDVKVLNVANRFLYG